MDLNAEVHVLEPMGMDTMVFIELGTTEVAARSAPKAVSGVGETMAFTIDMNNMHLIDPAAEKVV